MHSENTKKEYDVLSSEFYKLRDHYETLQWKAERNDKIVVKPQKFIASKVEIDDWCACTRLIYWIKVLKFHNARLEKLQDV